jgi:hypothetical protein
MVQENFKSETKNGLVITATKPNAMQFTNSTLNSTSQWYRRVCDWKELGFPMYLPVLGSAAFERVHKFSLPAGHWTRRGIRSYVHLELGTEPWFRSLKFRFGPKFRTELRQHYHDRKKYSWVAMCRSSNWPLILSGKSICLSVDRNKLLHCKCSLSANPEAKWWSTPDSKWWEWEWFEPDLFRENSSSLMDPLTHTDFRPPALKTKPIIW